MRFEVGTWQWYDDERSHSGEIWADISWRPRANLRLALGPAYEWRHDDWQYVTTEEALGSDRYIMGVLDQKTIRLTTRLDWTFTPNLSLQLYAQPFVSAGEYATFSEVVEPRADAYDARFDQLGDDRLTLVESEDPTERDTYFVDLDRDGTDDLSFENPDFNFKQLRSTVVLRWEYVSGSTLFFVWSQSRTAEAFTGSFAPLRDIDRLRKIDGDNIFSIKVNYYLNP